jgi:acyl transferase domain-containing protein/acyl carrier protein
VIAIIGMAVRAPLAPTAGELWERVAGGENCVQRFSGEASLSSVDQLLFAHGTRVPAGGVLDGITEFDQGFFGLSQLDAALLDPQQRVFLEVVRHALDDAAAPASRGMATGVFAGCGMSSYLINNLLPDADLIRRAGAYPLMLGNDKDFLATRVSHLFGLGGPSMTVQTACSTSLVAVHLAAQSLLAGECDAAIAGGVTIRVPQRRGYPYQSNGIMSADGVCRPLDAAGTGFVPSNGAAALVLRRLEDALADGDPIRAVLRASAVNNDGAARAGFTTPSVEGQVRVLSEALALSGLSPDEVTHIELHGTATELGDAVEFEALRRVYGRGAAPCYLGAAKANFGHTDTAAGALGLIKAILSLEHRQVPPVANFKRPNAQLEIDGTRFAVPSLLTEWQAPGARLRAGVTSLGLGGTNAHVIIEEPPARRPTTAGTAVLAVSGHSESAAAARARQVERAVTAQPDLADSLARSLAGQSQLAYRAVVVPSAAGPRASAVRKAGQATVAFAFPGGGAQHPGMAAALAAADPVFADALTAAISLVEPLTGPAVSDAVLRPDVSSATLRRPAVGLTALFCVQLAVWRLFEHWGVTPSAVIGHSSGDYAAACVAGVLEPAEAAQLVVTRARLFESAPAGAMIALPRPETEVRRYLDTAPGLEIAAVNGRSDTVVGGPIASLPALEARLAALGVPFQRVHVDVAAHTAAVAHVADALRQAAAGIPVRTPRVPWISNVTGTWITADDLGPEYWGAHLRQTVRFADGIENIIAIPGTAVLDMGPGQILKATLEQYGLPDDFLVLAALPHPRSPESPALHVRRTAAALWSAGVQVDLSAQAGGRALAKAALPPYPFERTQCWFGPPESVTERQLHQLYEPALESLDEPPARREPPAGGWLVISDGTLFAASMLAALGSGGAPIEAVIDAEGADALPERADLLTRARGVLLLAGSDPFATYHAMTAAARALAGQPHGARELVCVTDADAPVSGLSTALIRVIRNEYRGLRARAIEVGADRADRSRALRELDAADSRDVLLREGRRCERVLRRLPPPSGPAAVTPRDGGSWIITGGLGAIGRTLAVHLASTSHARLVLVVRSLEGEVPAEAAARAAAQQAIRAAGGAVEIVLGDIADPAVARAAVDRADRVYGQLDGIIHAAGLPSGGLIDLRDRAQADAVLRPKLGGLLALHGAVGDRELDAFVLCSALDAVLGTPGQAEHCAANGFLDAYAADRARTGRRVVSIGWSAWRDIGQAARAVVPAALSEWRERNLAMALTPAEGGRLFDTAIGAGRPHVVVAAQDPGALSLLASSGGRATADAPPKTVIGDSLRTPVERQIAELWAEVLAAPTVQLNDDFFALGGHSLAAMQLVSLLRETFDVPVTLTALLERPTLLEQAALIEDLLLDLIEQLDDAEVERRLRSDPLG